MINLSYNPFLNNLSERELILLAQKDCKYSVDAKNALLKHYQPYISNLLKRYPYYVREDLEILAYVGLLKAIELFNISVGTILITYAKFYIKKEIVNFIKNDLEITRREISELISEESQIVDYETYETTKQQNEIQMEKKRIEENLECNSSKRDIQLFITELTEQQKLLANLIFYQGYTATEVAKYLSISKPRITQLLNSIKAKGRIKLSKFNNN